MKALLVVPLVFLSSAALAETINPFMSAADRQQLMEETRQMEEVRLQEMVTEAVKEIQANAAQGTSNAGPSNASGAGSSGSSSLPREAPPPSDFAIAGIKGNTILIRQMDNRSMMVTSGDIFYDKGEAYKPQVKGHGSISITRVSDGEVVFYGGAGSTFTPSGSTEMPRASRNRDVRP